QKEDERNRCDSVRERIREFDRLAEERQFYTALTTPAGDKPLYQDSHRGEDAGRKALALADDLLTDLAGLPLPNEREAFGVRLYDLLLLTAQSRLMRTPTKDGAEEARANLERAVALRTSSRGSHRLLARCYDVLGDPKRRDEHAQRA